MTTERVRTTSWKGEIPVHYLYTFGLAGERFFREVKERGAFVGARCEVCRVTYVPPWIFCERCFAELNDLCDVGTRGTVETFTRCFERADGTRLAKPEIVAYVRIDGTGGGLVHRLTGVAERDVKIGMKVEALFAEPSRRCGGIGDILGFRPVY